jgi:hypothetical protein
MIQESDEDDTIEYTTSFKYEFDEQGNWIKKYIQEGEENTLPDGYE